MLENVSDRVKKLYRKGTGLVNRVREYPGEWFANSLETAVAENRVNDREAAVIRAQIADPKSVPLLTDIFVCSVGIRGVLKPIDVALLGASAYNEDPMLALYALAAHSTSRFLYLGSRIAYDRFWVKEGQQLGLRRDLAALALAVPLVPIIGNFAAPYRASSYPELAKFAMKDTAHKASTLLKTVQPNNHYLPTVYRPGL